MNREISSKWTFYYKFIFPTLWIGGFTLTTVFMFLFPAGWKGSSDIRKARWIFLGITIAGATVIYWSCMRLKKVYLRQNSLVVSNYLTEVSVPLQQIERVSGSVFMAPELVWVHFRRPTQLGRRIVFMPTMRWFPGFSRHPIVRELWQLTLEASRGR